MTFPSARTNENLASEASPCWTKRTIGRPKTPRAFSKIFGRFSSEIGFPSATSGGSSAESYAFVSFSAATTFFAARIVRWK